VARAIRKSRMNRMVKAVGKVNFLFVLVAAIA
jgi:hypothetical protein